MRLFVYLAFFCSLALLGGYPIAHARGDAPATMPSMMDLKQMHDSGNYRGCLQQIARVMQLSASAGGGYDKYELLMLRGDCLLHLDDSVTAIAAYNAAAKSPVPSQANEAIATVLLIKKSNHDLIFSASGGLTGGLSIIERDNRLKAIGQLFSREFSALTPRIKEALAANTLIPIIKLQPQLEEAYALETTATGKDEQLEPLLKEIGEHSCELMSRELQGMLERSGQIRTLADKQYDTGMITVWGTSVVDRRGLNSKERQELRDMIDYARRIGDAAVNSQKTSVQLGADGKNWDPVLRLGEKVVREAQNVLETE